MLKLRAKNVNLRILKSFLIRTQKRKQICTHAKKTKTDKTVFQP